MGDIRAHKRRAHMHDGGGGGREKKLHIFKFYLSKRKKGEQKKREISIYFHLPFAEKSSLSFFRFSRTKRELLHENVAEHCFR